MHRLAAVAAMLFVARGLLPLPAAADPVTCRAFPSQAHAQAHYRDDPADHRNLDADQDGVACESLPCPCDYTAVSVPPLGPPPPPSSELAAPVLRPVVDYLPSPDALPPGFERRPLSPTLLSQLPHNQAVVLYERRVVGGAGGGTLDDVTRLAITIEILDSPASASWTFAAGGALLAMAYRNVPSFRVEELDGIGDTAALAQAMIDLPDGGTRAEVSVGFQIGPVVVAVSGIHFADQPTVDPDAVLQLARFIEARLLQDLNRKPGSVPGGK